MNKSTRKRAGAGKGPKVGRELVRRLRRFVEELPQIEELGDRFTCRTVKFKLPRSRYSPALVKSTRELLHASQAVFAQFLGVSASAVRDWEQGLKAPRGSSCRLMDEVRRDPEYWRKRLRESVVAV
ncbi:MAG TPA: hypothetical protein VMP01_11480 [Pirellulaceae bacterium]|nr:hypothetical protein [Pirellulaceae bacterium]